MNTENNKYNDSYTDYIDQLRKDKLQKEFQPKPFNETWKSTYYASKIFRWCMQCISMLTSAGAITFFLYIMFGNIWVSIAISGLAIMVLEYTKSTAYNNLFRSKLQFNYFSYASLAFILVTGSISTILSFVGAPKFVAVISPKPNLVDVDSIRDAGMVELDSLSAFYERQINDKEQQAQSVKDKYSWKGKITRDARPLSTSIESSINSTREKLENSLSEGRARVRKQIEQAEKDNIETANKHSYFLDHIGTYAMVATLIIELLILLCVYWCVYYKFRSYKELSISTGIRETKSKDIPREPIFNEKKQRTSKEPVQEKPKKECAYCGDMFTPKGYAQKYCKKVHADGRNCKDKAYNDRRKKGGK